MWGLLIVMLRKNGRTALKKLILIEGLFGSGKSTTAESISNNLCSEGFTAKHYVEFDVKLIVFEQASPEDHILKVIEKRKKEYPNWLPYICDLFENQQWAKNKNIAGLNGFIETQIEWSKLFTTIVHNLECNKLVITNPDTNWDETLEAINNYSLA